MRVGSIFISGNTLNQQLTIPPVYEWQAGLKNPMLRLLLLLNAPITIAMPMSCRVNEVNHHILFVDVHGNTPDRFVTHELLKRHLGCDVSMAEFEELEQLPGPRLYIVSTWHLFYLVF